MSFTLLKAHLEDEIRAGFPTLGRIPSSRVIRFLDFFDTLTVADRGSMVDALARLGATRISRPGTIPGEEDPVFLKCRTAMMSARYSMGLRHEGLRMTKAVLSDRQSREMMVEVRSKLDFIPRDDFPPALVADPDPAHLKPAKAPQLRKLIDAEFKKLFAPEKRKLAGGETVYTGVLDGTPITVRIDYAARSSQMRYSVTTPQVPLLAYEELWAAGQGWDYLTEENAEASIQLLCELVKKITSLALASQMS